MSARRESGANVDQAFYGFADVTEREHRSDDMRLPANLQFMRCIVATKPKKISARDLVKRGS